MALLSSLKQIAGVESSPKANEFMAEFFKLVLGTLSLPIDLPGTNYRRGFQVIFNTFHVKIEAFYVFKYKLT